MVTHCTKPEHRLSYSSRKKNRKIFKSNKAAAILQWHNNGIELVGKWNADFNLNLSVPFSLSNGFQFPITEKELKTNKPTNCMTKRDHWEDRHLPIREIKVTKPYLSVCKQEIKMKCHPFGQRISNWNVKG